jgi:hypothetical protein
VSCGDSGVGREAGQRSPSVVRMYHAVAYDSRRDKVIVFGS